MCGCKGKCGCNIISTTKGEKGDASPVASLGYKVYIALLTQAGTDAPTAVVLENTLGGTPVWSYVGTGNYLITLSGVFIENKTVPYITPTNNSSQYRLYWNNVNSLELDTTTFAADAGQDEILFKTTVEIRVYP